MQKEIHNPVSREIVNNSVWHGIGDYFPTIVHCSDMNMQSWTIKAMLPEGFYRKWIAYIIGNPHFREMVEKRIEDIFRHHVFGWQSFLEIHWSSKGVSFETDGVNGCMVYPSFEGIEDGYFCHNVDNFEQASVLFLALSVCLPILYYGLELYEREEIEPEFPPLQKEKVILKRVDLNNERRRKRKKQNLKFQ